MIGMACAVMKFKNIAIQRCPVYIFETTFCFFFDRHPPLTKQFVLAYNNEVS